MRVGDWNPEHFRQAQDTMLRLAERDFGLSPGVLSARTGIPVDTLRSYRITNGRAQSIMSAETLVRLAAPGCVPPHLISLLFELSDKQVIDSNPSQAGLLGLAAASAGLSETICNALADGAACPVEKRMIADEAREVSALASGFAETVEGRR